MRSRDRVIKAIEREEPDRVPLDVAFRPEVWKALREHFRTSDDEGVKRKLGVDIRNVMMYPPTGFKPISPSPYAANEALVSYECTIFDEWGIKREVGTTGRYWHINYHPLEHISLDEYEFPSLDLPGRFELAEKQIKELGGEYAMAGTAYWGLFERAWALRGFRRFILDLHRNPRYANKLLDRLLEWKLEQAKRFVELGVDILELGDDLGMQTGMIISPDLFRKYFKPRYEKLTQLKRKGVYIFLHSCGKIEPIIPDLIDVGIEILNPVQPDCVDPAELKSKYGDRLAFHGTISLQKTLTFGSVGEVKNEVLTRIKTVGVGGGLILAPANTAGSEVPLQNLLAVYETVKSHPYHA